MTVSKLPPSPKKYKTALFRRRIIERLRLEMVSEQQVLTQLGISRTLLNQWNRTYQRYQRVWCGVARAV
jgi:transposase-like protein